MELLWWRLDLWTSLSFFQFFFLNAVLQCMKGGRNLNLLFFLYTPNLSRQDSEYGFTGGFSMLSRDCGDSFISLDLINFIKSFALYNNLLWLFQWRHRWKSACIINKILLKFSWAVNHKVLEALVSPEAGIILRLTRMTIENDQQHV